MYRNIDEDINLFKIAKRYHSEKELSLDQAKWVLKDQGYSSEEVEKAIFDYYLCHIRPEIFANNFYKIILFSIIVYLIILIFR
jgi:hypothetical protein